MDSLALLERVQAVARDGLHYATNPYDRARYEQLLTLAVDAYAVSLGAAPDAIRRTLAAELAPVTPKLGATAAIFDDEGRLLVMKRADSGRWCMPCGLVEPGESPEQAALREASEETGVEAEIAALVGVYTRLPHADYTPYTLVSAVYLCTRTGGELRSSHEDRGLAYMAIDQVTPWHGEQLAQASDARVRWAALHAT